MDTVVANCLSDSNIRLNLQAHRAGWWSFALKRQPAESRLGQQECASLGLMR